MIEQLSTLVRQLTISQRIGIVFGSLMSVLLLVGLVMWAGTPQMVTAFNDLAVTDTESITAALDSAGIPYELASGGTEIKVGSADVSAARVAAGSAGYSADGTTGWETFDSPGFGASEFDQSVAYQRALQGEKEREIEKMTGVQDASVTIVAAQQGVLATDDQTASASVYVKMTGGRQPGEAMVASITSLVAASVAGLTPANVTVVDANGQVLAGPNNESSTALTIQGTVERALAAKARAYLATIYGADMVNVAVTARLDLDKVARTVRSYEIGEGNPAVSTQWTREIVGEGAANGSTGIPGTTSNVPGIPAYPGASPAASPAATIAPDYVKEGATINYANTETVSEIIQAPGAVEGLSISALIDATAFSGAGVSAEDVQAGLEAAMGVVKSDVAGERNDTVKVVSSARFPVAVVADAGLPTAMIGDIVPTVAGGLLALILLFLVWRNMKALRGRAEDMQLLAARMSPAQLGSGELAMAGAGGYGGFDESGIPEIAPLSSPQAKVQERMRLMAEERPEEIAALVTTLLHEDKKGRRR